MFGYYSSLNLSTHSCYCTDSFACQCEVPSAEENNMVLRSDPCYYRSYVRSTHGWFNAFHYEVMKSLIVFIKLENLYFIHRHMMYHTIWEMMLENCVVFV